MFVSVASSESADSVTQLTVRSGVTRALLALMFFYPVVLCAVFFPSPAGDLREHINLGLRMPLHTWDNPPLQTWVTGVIALAGAYDSWAFVLAAQVINLIGPRLSR